MTVRHAVNGGDIDRRRRWSHGLRVANAPLCGAAANGMELNRDAAQSLAKHADLYRARKAAGIGYAGEGDRTIGAADELCAACLAAAATAPRTMKRSA